MTARLVVLLVCFPLSLSAQVEPIITLRHNQVTTTIQNPTDSTLSISVELWHGTSTVLAKQVDALISPYSFQLKGHESQVVRIRIRETVPSGETLRLVTLFTPLVPTQTATSKAVRTSFTIQTRIISRVVNP